MEIAERVAKNTFYNLTAFLCGNLFTFLASVLVARHLGPTLMGEYSFLIWLLSLLHFCATLGLPSTMTRFLAEALGRGEVGEVRALFDFLLRRLILLASGIGAAVLALSLFIAHYPLNLYLILITATFLPLTVVSFFSSTLIGLQRFDVLAKLTFLNAPLRFLLILIVLMGDGTIGWLLLAFFVANLFHLVSLSMAARRELGRARIPLGRMKLPADLTKRMGSYSLGISLVLSIDVIVWQRSEVFFLKQFSPAPEIAFYALAFGLAAMVIQIPYQFTRLLMPLFTETLSRRGLEELRPLYRQAIKYQALLSFPLGLGVAAVAPPLLAFIYGKAYGPMILPFQVMAVGGIFGALSAPASAVLHSLEAQRLLLRQGLIAAAFNLALDLLLIPPWGAVGAALANSLAQAMAAFLVILYATGRIGAPYPYPGLLKILLSSLIMICVILPIVIYSSFFGHVIAAIAGGAAAYLLALRVTSALEPSDLRPLDTLAPYFPLPLRPSYRRMIGFICQGSPHER